MNNKMRAAIVLLCVSVASCLSYNVIEVSSEPKDCEFVSMIWGAGETQEESIRKMKNIAATLKGNTLLNGWPNFFSDEERRRAEEKVQKMSASKPPYTAVGAMYDCENAYGKAVKNSDATSGAI